ncbi:MAG: PAS domain S-box protein [Thermodesulfobacteriota bacterium]
MRKARITPIFVIACVVAVAYHLLIVYVIAPAFTGSFVTKTEDEARLIAHHITTMVLADRDTLPPARDLAATVSPLVREFHLEKLTVFNKEGVILYSTTPAEIGSRNAKAYFHTLVAQGRPATKVAKKGEFSLEGRLLARDVVETYMPIMRGGEFIGAVELYYDITDHFARHDRVLTLATTLPLLLMFLFLLAVIVLLFRGDQRQLGKTADHLPAQSPHFSLLFTLASIFAVEFLVMLLLEQWHLTSNTIKALVDALLLALFITPLLYLFINRPLLRHIAERRKTEEALRDSQERFRDLFENTTDLIQSIDANGRFLYVNPAWRQTLGYTEEETKRMKIFDILAPEEIAHCQAAFGEVMAGRALERIETVFLARDGRRVLVEGNATVKFAEGKPLYTRTIFHDITARKEAEAQMERLIAELQKSLAEVKTLSGLLPICSWCKKIRDDKGYWNQLESYISQHSSVDFSHGICPECMRKHYPELMDDKEKK